MPRPVEIRLVREGFRLTDNTSERITVELLLRSWIRSLKARNLSPRTVQTYEQSVKAFLLWAEGRDINRWLCEEFLDQQAKIHKPNTVRTRYKALNIFFTWCVEEEELQKNPLTRVSAPFVPDQPSDVFTAAEIKALLASVAGKRRDLAIFHLLLDTGLRCSELCNLTLDNLNLDQNLVFVIGKGRKPRVVPFGNTTARSLDRWLRIRKIEGDSLFGLGPNGLPLVLKRAATKAGVTGAHLHKFRHTFCHHFLVNGGSESDLMLLCGWSSRAMLARYASALATERAVSRYRSTLDLMY